ncbi:MAG TPA: helix-turn-helix domain-containing protein [Nocardioides sp.]|nr:helix-turn-helix domain-containing protein [Nocardioides sp.]
MRNRGWQGDPPANDEEARARIVAAAMRCIAQFGPNKTGLSDVAAEVGVTRQTVYRLFPSTEELFSAVSVVAAETFLGRLVARVQDFTELSEMLVECVAFTLEQLDQERHLSLLLDSGRVAVSEQFTSSVPSDLTRTFLTMLPVDWAELGVTSEQRDLLIEVYLRTLQSVLIHAGRQRDGKQMRAFLRVWLAPAVDAICGRSLTDVTGG